MKNHFIEKIKKIYPLYKIIKFIYIFVDKIFFFISEIISLISIWKVHKKIVKRHKCSDTKIKVVFIIQYIPAWNKLESIYRMMLSDDRFEPLILCVPMNKGTTGQISNEINDTYEYFISRYVELCSYL